MITASDDGAQYGLVIANHGYALLVETAGGVMIPCVGRRTLGGIYCGDRVRWKQADGNSGVIVGVEPRNAVLARPDTRGNPKPLCVNLDQIVIVGLATPETGTMAASDRIRIDAYLAAAELLHIEALVLINKADLYASEAARAALDATTAPWRDAGYDVLYSSTRTGAGIDALRARLHGRRSVLVGESGAGKSSLAGELLPEREIRIGEISSGIGRGRHTTTVTMLFHLPDGGDIIDSPGVREFRLGKIPPAELAGAFRDFRPFLGECRYRDCRHVNERDCALEQAVADKRLDANRLASYRALLDPQER
ncbi:MAG: ribosome small subunit-dependent GTPase A [Gammaproteobacteria bacterium]|jgi:ribosome biogenesis GTPase|nr:ribosome small subunit-dependent GTPase A [Gammaproteobacteria bacterium]